MAYVDRHPKSPFYRAIFRDADGKRVCRSLKTKDKRIAKKLASELELAAKTASSGQLSTDRARLILNQMLVTVGSSPLDSESVRVFFTRWLASKERTKAENTGKRYGSVVRDFLACLGHLAEKPLSAIQSKHVDAFLISQTGKGRSPASLRMDLKIVAGVFSFAMKQGYISNNPALAVEIDEAKSVARDCFTMDEVESLLASATADWKTTIMLGTFAGLRLGDATSLTWECVDLVKGVLTFVPQKTKRMARTLVVPIHPKLQTHLESFAGDDPVAPLAPSLIGRGTGGASGLSRQFAKLMQKVGIQREQRKTSKTQARSVSSKSFHSLRHTFNTALMNAGVDEPLRMALSGHSTAQVNRQYSHAEISTLRDAVAKI